MKPLHPNIAPTIGSKFWSYHRSSSQGYILVSLCLLLPFLLFAAHGVGWLFWFQKEKEKTEFLCHTHLLKAQNYLIQGTDNLLNLNPIAKSLTLKKKALRAALRVAPAATKIPILLAIKNVIGLQKLLNLKQKGLIMMANSRAQMEIYTLQKRLQKHLSEMSKSWGLQSVERPRMHFTRKTVQTRIAYRDVAHQYDRKKNYHQVQQLNFQWKLKMHSNFSPNFHLKKEPNTWFGQCFTHPHERKNQWHAHLGKAKSL